MNAQEQLRENGRMWSGEELCVSTRPRSGGNGIAEFIICTCPGDRAVPLVDRHSLSGRLSRARERLERRTPACYPKPPIFFLSVRTMSKRELETLAQVAIDLEGPRTKRRRETPAEEGNGDVKMQVEEDEDAKAARLATAKEQGEKLWHAVKDAVDKEQVSCSLFLTSTRSPLA